MSTYKIHILYLKGNLNLTSSIKKALKESKVSKYVLTRLMHINKLSIVGINMVLIRSNAQKESSNKSQIVSCITFCVLFKEYIVLGICKKVE